MPIKLDGPSPVPVSLSVFGGAVFDEPDGSPPTIVGSSTMADIMNSNRISKVRAKN